MAVPLGILADRGAVDQVGADREQGAELFRKRPQDLALDAQEQPGLRCIEVLAPVVPVTADPV